jgi:hypothetical protein
MRIFKYLASFIILGLVLNCSKISEKVEQKVNEKVNEKIDENLKKVDSSLDRSKIDSLMRSLDTLKSKADSLLNEENDRQTRKAK